MVFMSTTIAPELAELTAIVNVATAQIVAATAEALGAGDTNEAGMTSPAAWLAWRTGLSPERAGQLVKLAKVRERYPLLFTAFERGEISADQLTELVKAPEWAQQQMLAFAEIGTVGRLRRAIRDEAFEHDPDEAHEEKATRAPKERLSFGVKDSQWRINGACDIDRGKLIEAALTESKDRLFDEGDTDATWVDALVDIAERSLAAVPSRDRRDRYRTWFHHDTRSGATTTTDGWRIPQSIARLCTCDGSGAIVLGRDGLPFSVGRTQYIVPDRTRRIVMRRDRGCRVPGCTADRFVEVHHIVHWEDGGPTDTWNLICLCPKHHRMHHKGELGATGDADDPDGVVFTDARGSPIVACCAPAPPGRLPDCEHPYEHPPAGRMNYDWVGLGWAHPNALKRRAQQSGRFKRG
jgi:Domain of unknown function (DUF222)/HNH endonuclease